MKYCPLLYDAINFEPGCIQPCCDVRALGVPSFPFSGGILDAGEYRAHIDNVFGRLQEGAQVCSGCPDLFDVDSLPPIPESGLRLQSVSFNQHRYFCNCRCVYCNLWKKKGAEKPYEVLPALVGLYKQNAFDEKCVFSWGGGEPSILPEFEAVCRWIMSHGYFQYVHTSALHFSRAVALMLAEGKGKINVSLDSGNAEGYAVVKGLNGWDKVVSNLEKYAAACVDTLQIDLKFIIFDLNNELAVIDDFFSLCKRLEIKNVQYSLDFREVNAGKVSDKTLLGAAYFRQRARELGLELDSFYVDARIAERIDALERAHFGGA